MQSSAVAWGSKYGILAWWSLNLSEDVTTSVVTFEFDGMFGAQRFWRKASGKSRVSHALKLIFVASDLKLNSTCSQRLVENSIWVSRINYESAEFSWFTWCILSLKTNRSPSWDLHWHDFRSPTGASVQFTQTLQMHRTSWGMFLCVLLVWVMERPACGTSKKCWCQTLAFARSFIFSFPSHVSRQCMVEVTHGCFGVSGTHDFCFICEESPSLRMSFDFNSARVSRPGHLTLNGALEREPDRCSLLVKRS